MVKDSDDLTLEEAPARLAASLGLAQQCWHMANAACKALGLRFEEASPKAIFDGILKLQRDLRRIRRAARKAG